MKKVKEKPFNAVSSRIDPEIHKAVKVLCAREGLSVQEFFKSALIRELQVRRTGKK